MILQTRSILAILISLSCVLSCIPNTHRPNNVQEKSTLPSDNSRLEDRLELPSMEMDDNSEIIEYTGFTVCYSHKYLIPNWVAYEMTKDHITNPIKSDYNEFHSDSHLHGSQASLEDYKGIYKSMGLSRGHMAPKRDMKWDEKALEESFTLTNVCPQSADLNNGQWRRLEEHTRLLCERLYDKIYIVCGPIIGSNKFGQVGPNKVYVPDSFFKALLVRKPDGQYSAIGFIFPNEKCDGSYVSYATSVSEIEKATGLTLFASLKNESVKDSYNKKDW